MPLLSFPKSLNWSPGLQHTPFKLGNSTQTIQLFTVYPKTAVLFCFILMRLFFSSFLELKQSRIIWTVPGKGQQCGQEPWSSAGSAENRRAVKNALRIRADTKPENGNIFAEVLVVLILKEHMRLWKKNPRKSENSLFFKENILMSLPPAKAETDSVTYPVKYASGTLWCWHFLTWFLT